MKSKQAQPAVDYAKGEENSLKYLMWKVMSDARGSASPDSVLTSIKDALTDFGASAYPKTKDGVKEFIRKEKYGK